MQIFFLAPDIICSCIEAVDELFQDTLAAWNMMSIPFLYVYVWQLSILLRKKENFNILAADTICSCTEAVDKLFQHTLGHECMEPYVNTNTLCVYMSIA